MTSNLLIIGRAKVPKFRSNAQFTPPARHDKTVLSVSCQAV